MSRPVFYFLPFLFFTCGPAQETETDQAPPPVTSNPTLDALEARVVEGTNEERLAELDPPPPLCQKFTPAEVLSVLGEGTRIMMPGSRSTKTYRSCAYEVDGPFWRATVAFEQPNDQNSMDELRAEMKQLTQHPPTEIDGSRAVYGADFQDLYVNARFPYRVVLLPKPNKGMREPFDEAERKRLLVALAGMGTD